MCQWKQSEARGVRGHGGLSGLCIGYCSASRRYVLTVVYQDVVSLISPHALHATDNRSVGFSLMPVPVCLWCLAAGSEWQIWRPVLYAMLKLTTLYKLLNVVTLSIKNRKYVFHVVYTMKIFSVLESGVSVDFTFIPARRRCCYTVTLYAYWWRYALPSTTSPKPTTWYTTGNKENPQLDMATSFTPIPVHLAVLDGKKILEIACTVPEILQFK